MTIAELRKELETELANLKNYNDNDIVMTHSVWYDRDGFPTNYYDEIESHPFRYNLIVNKEEADKLLKRKSKKA